MYPVLLKIGGITIHTYGVLHALGFLSGIWIARREAGRIGENPKNIMDLSVYIFISSLIGARVFFILFDGHLQSYLESPADVLKVWEGGLTYYGGFIFGVLISIWYTRKHRLNFWRTADIIAPAIAIGIAISRFGCFASGDSYGKPTALPWGVTFSSSHSLAPTGIPLHPTQLYSVLSNFLIFLVLMALRKPKRFEGELILLFTFLYAVTRSAIEVLRDDPPSLYFGGSVSTPQLMSVARGLMAIFLFFYLRSRRASSYHFNKKYESRVKKT